MHVVKFTPDTYKNCCVAQDFYEATGIKSAIDSKQIKSVYQMKINGATYRAIEERMKSNWWKNKFVNHLPKGNAQTQISFQWMMYSPMQDKSVPENEIWWEDIKDEKAADL